MRPAEGQVLAHGLRRGTPERDEPLLPALPEHTHHTVLERDAVLLEPHSLGDPKPGTVEELHERTVTQGAWRRPDRGVDETLRLGRRERTR